MIAFSSWLEFGAIWFSTLCILKPFLISKWKSCIKKMATTRFWLGWGKNLPEGIKSDGRRGGKGNLIRIQCHTLKAFSNSSSYLQLLTSSLNSNNIFFQLYGSWSTQIYSVCIRYLPPPHLLLLHILNTYYKNADF